MTDLLRTVDEGAVRRIVLDRPEKKNALTHAMYDRLDALLRAADAEPSVRVVQIESAGDDFCSGNDIAEFAAGGGMVAAHPDGLPVMRYLDTLIGFGKPIVAAVSGAAIGIGTTMLFHCDIVVATEDATFGLPFVKLGLVPEAASSLLLPALAGYQRAAELLLLGETFDARAAYEMRLVNRLVPAAGLAAAARHYAGALASRPPEAVRLSRQLLRGDRAVIQARKDAEATVFLQCLSSPEVAASLAAFLSRSRS